MMIESVPFMHVIAKKIIKGIGPEHPEEIIATTMVSFAVSSILTGAAFFALGALKLGNLMGCKLI
jgi:SulP family sulfate permease